MKLRWLLASLVFPSAAADLHHSRNHFEVLGVSESSSDAQIKKAYKALAKRHHPDKGGDQRVFIEVTTAYEVLSDRDKRTEYLDELRYGEGENVASTFHRRGRPGGHQRPRGHHHFGHSLEEEEEEVFVFRAGNGQQFFYHSSSGRQRHHHHPFNEQFFQQPPQMPFWLQVAIVMFNMSSAMWLLIMGSCFIMCAAWGTTSDAEKAGKEGKGGERSEFELPGRITHKALQHQPPGEICIVAVCAPCRQVLNSPAFRETFRHDNITFSLGEVQEKFATTGLLAVAVKKKGEKWSGLILRKRECVADEDEEEGEKIERVRRHLQKFVLKTLNGETTWICAEDYPLPLAL